VTSPFSIEAESGSAPFAYVRPTAGRDEVFDADGAPRPHARRLVAALEALGEGEMQRRWDQARRLIRDNGVTYNVYGDPRGMDRPWELDPVPLVMDAGEWAGIARGLEQRAELLNRVLVDVYGEQRLLASGLLPAELVLMLPSFLRPVHGAPLPGGIALHVAAVDLARGADGGFVVLGDRTQAPSGAGYALENRIVLSRTLPEIFHECRVERLASYFRALRETLLALAPRRESPRIVLLTPGPHNETYFEHAYLARYLGFALVEGADLTVRDRHVYVKTLGGLERVDVILRRLDDSFSDPLSLRPDSSLGVAGLVHAVRAGNVAVANALGSGFVETPALLPFLPALCRELLGEELRLPSVPTFWCGDPDSARYVLEHLDTLVVKPAAFGPSAFEPVFVGTLSSAEKARLRERIAQRPASFVAQAEVALSTAPVWGLGRPEPRHVALRGFVTHSSRGYLAMPGGLARISATPDSLVVSMQRGGGSKDVWVQASGGVVSSITLLPSATDPVALVRSGDDLPSRTADNFYWLARYLERAESTVRLLRSLFSRVTNEAVPGVVTELRALLRAIEVMGELTPGSLAQSRFAESRRLDPDIAELLLSRESSHTLPTMVSAAHRSGSIVRDRLGGDSWRVVSQLEQRIERAMAQTSFQISDALDLLGELVLLFSAWNGLSHEDMTHGPGWQFADMGRRIERLLQTTRLLRAVLVDADPADGPTLEALLEVTDSAITYRTRYLGTLQVPPVLDLLLTDDSNPRSVVYQLVELERHVRGLPRSARRAVLSDEVRIAIGALARVRLADVVALSVQDPASGERRVLAALLGALETDATGLSESLTRSCFTHAQPSRSLNAG
jgi:uncharacterized circularly permuted ATP-grasp superfamily protein/uncharacterized alpha-E superfamily protein